MTESTTIAVRDDALLAAVATAAAPAVPSLAEQARQWDVAYRYGQAVCRSQIIPDAFRVKPSDANTGRDPAADIAVVALRAEPLGIDLMTALETMFVVKGRVSMSAKMKAALIRRAGHELTEVSASDECVRYHSRRRDSGIEHVAEWTIDRARRAKYTENEKYKTNPQQMLRWKCISEIGDALYSDLLLGIPSREDLLLDDEPDRAPVARPSTRVTTADILGEQPAVDPTPAPAPEQSAPARPPRKATNAEINTLMADLGPLGLTERDEVLAWISAQIGRDIGSTKELTTADIDTLRAAVAEHQAMAAGEAVPADTDQLPIGGDQ